jgi:hypothetical protein
MGINSGISISVVYMDIIAVRVVAGDGIHFADSTRSDSKNTAAGRGHNVQSLMAGEAKLGIVLRIGPKILINAAKLSWPYLETEVAHGSFSLCLQLAKTKNAGEHSLA